MKILCKTLFLLTIFTVLAGHLEATSQRLADFTATADQTATADADKFTTAVTTIITKLTPQGTLPKEIPYYKEQVEKVFDNAQTHAKSLTLGPKEKAKIQDAVNKLIKESKAFFTNENLTLKADAKAYKQWVDTTEQTVNQQPARVVQPAVVAALAPMPVVQPAVVAPAPVVAALAPVARVPAVAAAEPVVVPPETGGAPVAEIKKEVSEAKAEAREKERQAQEKAAKKREQDKAVRIKEAKLIKTEEKQAQKEEEQATAEAGGYILTAFSTLIPFVTTLEKPKETYNNFTRKITTFSRYKINDNAQDDTNDRISTPLFDWAENNKTEILLTDRTKETLIAAYINFCSNFIYEIVTAQNPKFTNNEEILAAIDNLITKIGEAILPLAKRIKSEVNPLFADLKYKRAHCMDASGTQPLEKKEKKKKKK